MFDSDYLLSDRLRFACTSQAVPPCRCSKSRKDCFASRRPAAFVFRLLLCPHLMQLIVYNSSDGRIQWKLMNIVSEYNFKMHSCCVTTIAVGEYKSKVEIGA